MAFGIRKINRNGIHYNFKWPMEVGAVATAPDWRPNNECGGGLHFCTPTDNFKYLGGDLWAVIEYDESKVINLAGKHKVETCKLVYLSESPDGILDFFKDTEFTKEMAYFWADNIGDRKHMRQFVTDPEWAYFWAVNIGDHEYMRQFVTTPVVAYYWALNIGDREHMQAICKGTEYEF